MRKIAIAIFVKTPGYSPLKTRLAVKIGEEAAYTFYKYSVEAIQELCECYRSQESRVDIQPLFAVAEQEAMGEKIWASFNRVPQGEGDLGQRLAFVENLLCEEYDGYVFIGADAPQISMEQFSRAISMLLNGFAAIGRCSDGGFYLYGQPIGCRWVPWRQLEYSVSDTCHQLEQRLNKRGITCGFLSELSDVDEGQDLKALHQNLRDSKTLLPMQIQLRDWLESEIPGLL